MARAFIRNSPILLLDEATSALDTENEEKIHQAMKKLTQGKTTIMIAHRFSSIRLANRIIVMDKGRIVSDGTHDELYQSLPDLPGLCMTTSLSNQIKQPLTGFPWMMPQTKSKNLQTIAWRSRGKLSCWF